MRSYQIHRFGLTRRWRIGSRLLTALIGCSVLLGYSGLVGYSGLSSGSTVSSAANLRRVTTVAFVGHGWGPGVGMGQWGAFGYAVRYHFGYERILSHYYGGTAAATVTSIGQVANPTISVVIAENMNLSTNVGYDPVVTSATPFTVTSNGGAPVVSTTTTTTPTLPPTSTVPTTTPTVPPTSTTTTTIPTSPATTIAVPAGTAIDLRLTSAGTWNAYEGSSCVGASSAATSSVPVATGLINPVVAPSVGPTAPLAQLLVLCRHDGVDESLRGSIEAYDRSGYERTLNLVPLESYLQGVVPSESSASWGDDGGSVGAPQTQAWGFQALEAQAVAARSYALAYSAAGGWNGYASICDTTSCQVYSAANYETAVSDAAVQATAGEIRIRPSAPTVAVLTQYSASTGGYTAPSVFGAVHDLGDACVVPGVALECNPDHTWQVVLDASVITKLYPTVGRLLSVHVGGRTGHGAFGGRALTVILRGRRSTVRVTGDAFSAALGLKSNWFAIAHLTRAGPTATATTTTTTTSTVITTTTATATTTTLVP